MDLIGFMLRFKDDKTCENYLTKRLFPKDISCSSCGCTQIYKLNTQTKYTLYKCSGCKDRFSILKNTIFENSRIGLQKWFLSMFLFTTYLVPPTYNSDYL